MGSLTDQQAPPIAVKKNGLLAGLHALRGILNWMACLVWVTEEELSEAGIYLDDKYTHI